MCISSSVILMTMSWHSGYPGLGTSTDFFSSWSTVSLAGPGLEPLIFILFSDVPFSWLVIGAPVLILFILDSPGKGEGERGEKERGMVRWRGEEVQFWMFCEISRPLSHAAYTERSTIVDLLIKIPGPLNPAAYWKVQKKFKRSEICFKKRSKVSNAPAWKFDKKISLLIAL